MTQEEFGSNAHRGGTAVFTVSFHSPAFLDAPVPLDRAPPSPRLDEAVIRAGWAIWSMAPGEGDPPAGDALVAAFLASEARVALIDATASGEEGLRAVQALGAVIAATGSAMLVAVPDTSAGTLNGFVSAGATHILPPGADDPMIHAAVRLAERHALRTLDVRRRRSHADGEVGEVHRWIADVLDRGRGCIAIVVSLSRLDLINAAHGRPAGNMLLRAVEARMHAAAAEAFGDVAIVARSGGAEFVMAGMAEPGKARGIAESLEALLALPFRAGAVPIRLGVRLGLAEHRPGEEPGALLARAGEALGQARASDGATLRLAHPGNVAPLDVLGADLHHAIERGEIDVVFQPQVTIGTGRITGVEALARWRHPTLGSLGADPLFAAAERADLGLALSDHIQQIALQRAARWPSSLSHLRLSINITAADVGRAGFARIFLERVAASDFPIDRLTVEITETGMISELDRAAIVLDTLRSAGVRVAIDDFGTGYSSLAYLTGLPIDYIKLDRALVTKVDGAQRDRIVVRGIIRIARRLGMGIIAEGVETREQARLLGRLGCETYQGFLRAGPLDEAALLAMVEKERECPD